MDEVKVWDYVIYTGPVKHWAGFYTVSGIDEQGMLRLREHTGAIISECQPDHVRVLYRPTAEELASTKYPPDGYLPTRSMR